MLLKKVFYDKINEELPIINGQIDIILYINQYIEPLSKIICNGFSFVDSKIDVYRFKQQYEPLNGNETFEIISDALSNIDEGLNNSFLNIIRDSENTIITYNGNISRVDGTKMILSLKNTTSDITEVTHEVIHRIYNSMPPKIDTIEEILKELFSEVNSITFESIINDSLKIDKNKYIEERMYSDISKSIYYIFIIAIFKTYKKYGIVDNEKLNKELDLLCDDTTKQAISKYTSLIANKAYKTIGRSSIDLLKYSKYIIANVISKTLYNRIKKGNLSYQEYLKQMLELNKIDKFEDALNILDVNYIYNTEKLHELNENYHNTCKNICGNRIR